VFALIFAAVALALIFTPTRFRKIAIAVVGIVCLVFLAIVLVNRRSAPTPQPAAVKSTTPSPPVSRRFDFDRYEREKRDKEDPQAKARIPVSELRFGQIQAVAGFDPGTIRSINARLYNDSSQFTLTDYSYYLSVQDCIPGSAPEKAVDHCTTVYDQRDSVALAVPPNQARDIVIEIPRGPINDPPPFKLLGTIRIVLTAEDTRAYLPKSPPQ
jgi:hypothetical protein